MPKFTMQEKLHKRKVHLPNPVLYWLLKQVMRILSIKPNVHFTYHACPGKDPSNIVLISNHASRNDYLFTAPAVLPKRLNYVVGYNEFFRFPLGLLLRWAQAIPKKNFTADAYTIKQILSVAKQGGSICFMPEGMSSITGMCQPVIPGGGKLLKKLGLPVYYTKISGGYLTYTKHCLDERPGRCEVIVDQMFTPEQLAELSPAEIEDTMNRLLAHDDYLWNKTARVPFRVKGGMAQKLDTLLYYCPKCGALYEMETNGDRMTCKTCGNAIEMDACGQIKPVGEGSVCPELVTDWTLLERKKAREMVSDPNFSISEHVKIGILPPYRWLSGDATSELCGEGTLTLNREGLHYEGTRCGKPWSFRLPPQQLPTYGMCTDISRLYTFVEGEFTEFYFEKGDVLLWDHLTEELHRVTGGKWQDTEYRHYN